MSHNNKVKGETDLLVAVKQSPSSGTSSSSRSISKIMRESGSSSRSSKSQNRSRKSKKRSSNEDTELGTLRSKLATIEADVERLSNLVRHGSTLSQLRPDYSDAESNARSVYVGNVNYVATAEELDAHFADCGTICRVTIVSNQFGQSRGFAYIEFAEPASAVAAMSHHGCIFRGRELCVRPKLGNNQRQFGPASSGVPTDYADYFYDNCRSRAGPTKPSTAKRLYGPVCGYGGRYRPY